MLTGCRNADSDRLSGTKLTVEIKHLNGVTFFESALLFLQISLMKILREARMPFRNTFLPTSEMCRGTRKCVGGRQISDTIKHYAALKILEF